MEISYIVKYCSFLTYNLCIYLFIYYLNIYNTWEIYKDWWYNEVKNNEIYDYIIGE